MHRYSCTILFAKISAVVGVVRVSMSQHDKLEVSRSAARAFKFSFDIGALSRNARVNQDVTGIGP